MLTQEIIRKYLDNVVTGLKADAQSKSQKIPENFRVEVDEKGGRLWGADYFQYLVLGRGPGKMPPLDPIIEWAKKFQGRDKRGRFITDKSLAWAVAKKIALHGTDIFQGKKPGIDFLGVMETNMPELVSAIAKNEAINILTTFKKELR